MWISSLSWIRRALEPMSHAFPVVNVFREDEVKPSMERELILKNAPDVKDGCFLCTENGGIRRKKDGAV